MSPFDNVFTTVDPATFTGSTAFIDSDTFSMGFGNNNSFGLTVNSMTMAPVTESVADFHTQMSNIASEIIESFAPVLLDKGQLVYGVQPPIVENSTIILTKADLAVSSLCHSYSRTMLM
jgi:hypothetical protein